MKLNDREKIEIYEQLLHLIQMHAEVTMNHEKVGKLIRNICNWSYAHRCGNGELTDEEQDQQVENCFQKLLEC